MERSKPQPIPSDAGACEARSEEAALRVRSAYPRDLATLVEFNRALARETEGKELDPKVLEGGVRAVFDDVARGSYLIAESSGVPVGCLMLTNEWSDWRNGVFWWIQSVYVVPSARKDGVFRALYERVVERARASREVCGIRLYVEESNAGARAVYERVGLPASHYRMHELDFVLGESRGHDAEK